MSRTHFGKRRVSLPTEGRAIAGNDINAGERYGPVVGNYVTLKLYNKVAVNNAADTVTCVLPLPMQFVPCTVSINVRGASGGTGAVQVAVTNSASAVGTANTYGTGWKNVPNTTPVTVLASAFDAGFAGSLAKGGALYLHCQTNAGGTNLAAAGAIVHVTGYFAQHTARGGRYAVSGQSKLGGPVAGFYDLWTIQNLITFPAGPAAVGSIIAPYAARVMAISVNTLGGAGYTANAGNLITVRNSATAITSNIPITAVAGSHQNQSVYAGGTLGFVSSDLRNVSRGDTINVYATLAGGAVPVGLVTVHILVWCKGHCDYTGYFDTKSPAESALFNVAGGNTPPRGGTVGGLYEVEPHAGSADTVVEGPALGGVMVVPFHNKRIATNPLRAEDQLSLPIAACVYAASFSKHTTPTDAIPALYRGTPATGDLVMPTYYTNQNLIAHREANNIGSFAGGIIAAGVPAGENSYRLRFGGGQLDLGSTSEILTLAIVDSSSSLALFSCSGFAFVYPTSHPYYNATND